MSNASASGRVVTHCKTSVYWTGAEAGRMPSQTRLRTTSKNCVAEGQLVRVARSRDKSIGDPLAVRLSVLFIGARIGRRSVQCVLPTPMD
jgi:hypothetical protein